MSEITYADAVIGILAADFPDLTKPHVAATVREAICDHQRARLGMEVIIDTPVSANWRLTGDCATGRVRLGCWRQHASHADRERQERLNTALEAIPAEDGEHR